MRIQMIITMTAVAAIGASTRADFQVQLDAAGQNGGVRANLGAELRPFDVFGQMAPVTISARTSIDPSSPFGFFAEGQVGTIYADDEGLGVQDLDGSGSKGISGGGGDQNEEIIFTFDALARADSIQIGLAEFDPGNGLGNDDDLAVFVTMAGGDSMLILESDYMTAFFADEVVEGSGRIDFGYLGGAGLASDSYIQSIAIRETNGHSYVNGLAFGQIPAPGVLVAFGFLGLFPRRRRSDRR